MGGGKYWEISQRMLTDCLRTGMSVKSKLSHGRSDVRERDLISWTYSSVSCRWVAWVYCSPAPVTRSDRISSALVVTPPVIPEDIFVET